MSSILLIFLIRLGLITFYFPKYQVAPGASGAQKVVMPRNMR